MDLRGAYRILEIEPGATREAAREARNILAKVWHPDRHQGDPKLSARAEAKLKVVNEAYATLEAAGFPTNLSQVPDEGRLDSSQTHRSPDASRHAADRGPPHNATVNSRNQDSQASTPPPKPNRGASTPPPRPAAPATAPAPTTPHPDHRAASGIVGAVIVVIVIAIVAARGSQRESTTASYELSVSGDSTVRSPDERTIPRTIDPPVSPAKHEPTISPPTSFDSMTRTPEPIPEAGSRSSKAKPEDRRPVQRASKRAAEVGGSMEPSPTRTFAVGSSARDVLAAQGKPDRVLQPDFSTEVWQYGSSTITLHNGRVSEYSNLGSLNVR